MGIVVVELCESSLINELNVEEILEAEYPEVSVLKSYCLSFCGMCAKRPYAIVNGKRIFAKSAEECLQKIREHIEYELETYM